MIDLQGRVAIVTGGGSGIGAGVAKVLADQGMKIALWDKHFDKNSPEVGERFECDITSEDAVLEALNKTGNALGLPSYLVNCAGIITAERLVGKEGPASLEKFHHTISVNLCGSFNTMRLVAKAMSEQDPYNQDGERGAIVNLASVAAFEGQIGQVAYAASKGGIVAMTVPAARELSKFGIRVNTIAPGIVDTPMMGQVGVDMRERLEDSIPFPKRYAKPEEIGRLVLHIFDNAVINGEVIRIDGAMRMPAR